MRLALLILIAGSGLAFARIGETPDECAMRYGSKTGNSAADQFTFQRNHVTIIVRFRDGRSTQEDFAPEAGGRLSESEIAQLLAENAEGSTWEKNGETPSATDYFRKDGKASARVAKEGAELSMQHAQLIIKAG